VRRFRSGRRWACRTGALAAATIVVACMTMRPEESRTDDSLSWLDEINGERALAWVREQNARTASRLTQSALFQRNYERARAVHLDREPMPLAGPSMLHEGWVYDLLIDAAHPRGLWRRIELQSLLSGSTTWQPLIDVTALTAAEGRPLNMALPVHCFEQRCLVRMEGTSATGFGVDVREFDLETRSFVKDGFSLPPSVTQTVWKDRDTLLVAGDFGADTLSLRQMPVTLREWRRGEQPADVIFRADKNRPWGITPFHWPSDDERLITVFDEDVHGGRQLVMRADGRLVDTFLPAGASIVGQYRGQVIIQHSGKTDWQVGPTKIRIGSFVSIARGQLGDPSPAVRFIFEPRERESAIGAQIGITRDGVLIKTYENIRGRLSRFTFDGEAWVRREIAMPDHGNLVIVASEPSNPIALVSYQSFVQPPTLYAVDVRAGEARSLLSSHAAFDASDVLVEQRETRSNDGTSVPYFLVRLRSLKFDRRTPTLMYGYGALAAPMLPHYDAPLGRLWLEEGGAYVLANVRGGGEFGPAWHVQGLDRQRTYEDFIAVAEDLIRRNVTSPRHLGIRGHSNGGLLVGATLNLRPDLFHAAVIEHPVLDLHLHTRDLDTDEYGAWSSPEERAYLEAQSPLQNLRKRLPFPAPLIKTATDDDVLPSQARKYASQLGSFGLPFYYFETAGGHHSLADTPQDAAYYDALVYTYLAERLK
jgi:prolyl oligopeptidase